MQRPSASRCGSCNGGARQRTVILPKLPANQRKSCAHQPLKNGGPNPVKVSRGSVCSVLRRVLSHVAFTWDQCKKVKTFQALHLHPVPWESPASTPRYAKVRAVPHINTLPAALAFALWRMNCAAFRELNAETDPLADAGRNHLLLLSLINCILNYDTDYNVEWKGWAGVIVFDTNCILKCLHWLHGASVLFLESNRLKIWCCIKYEVLLN